jgi:hypothetical protein
MVDIIKQDMTDLWAISGDIVAPDSAKVRAGWAVEAVPRQWWNWFENRQDTNIAYMLQKGIPEWDGTTEYLTNKSYVQRNNIVYKCILTGTNKDPASQPTYWVKAFPESSAYLEAIRPLAVVNNTTSYINGAGAAVNTPITTFGLSQLNTASAAANRTLNDTQQSNSNLDALSAVVASTNALPYFTGTTTMGTTTLTAFARTLLDDNDAAAVRATLGLTSAAITALQVSQGDNTAGRILTSGAFGMGRYLDLRNVTLTTGTPADIYGSGTTFGFVNGGTGTTGSLAIPGLTGVNYGTVQVNGQFADGTGLTAMSRVFIGLNGRTFSQTAASAAAWGPWSESWNSSNLVLTTTNRDTTAGRILKVGDFGLGGGVSLPTSVDLNTVVDSGFYRLPSDTTMTNEPDSAAGFGQMIVCRGADTISQTVFSYLGPRIWVRTGNPSTVGGAGVFTAWVEHYHTGNYSTLLASITASLQASFDAKVNKSGDTMSGQLIAPSILVTGSGAGGAFYMKANGSANVYDSAITIQNPGGSTGNGQMVFTAQNSYFTQTATFVGAVGFQSTINASGAITGSGLVAGAGGIVNSGTLANTGNVNSTAAVTSFTNTCVMANGSISILPPSKNNANSGSIGFLAANGTTLRGAVYVNPSSAIVLQAGDSVAALTCGLTQSTFGHRVTGVDCVMTGRVYTGNGNSFLETDGNIVGSVWPGTNVLSSYLVNTFLTPAGLPSALTALTAGAIGSYSLLLNKSGSGQSVNTVFSSAQLGYTDTGNSDFGAPPGTWRAMSAVNSLKATVFLRIA